MLGPSVYLRAMEMNRQTLGQRVSVTLWAKQYLVFFAIALSAIDFTVWATALWLAYGDTVDAPLVARGSLLQAILHGPSAVLVTLVIASLALTAWLRAGYIRSVVGSLHFAPRGGAQWLSLFGLLVITEAINWGASVGYRAAGSSELLNALIYLPLLTIGFVLLYADYAIVITGLNPLAAIRRSWLSARRTWFVSFVVLLGVSLILNTIAILLGEQLSGRFVDALPLLVAYVLTVGTVSFFADVTLIIAYIDAIERGKIPSGEL